MVCGGELVIMPHIPVTRDQVPTECERLQQLLWANLYKTVDIPGKTSPMSPDSLVLFESTFHSSPLLVKPFLCR